MALDYASARVVDSVGRMRIASCKISAAVVNDYRGDELVGGAQFGLDRATFYPVLRPADALKAAAASFEGVPVMLDHYVQTADQPMKHRVVGSVSNVRFDEPWLVADLMVWDSEAIAAIQSGSAAGLSCGYQHDTFRSRGTYDGKPFAFRMRNIRGNHVALVDRPRVSGAYVADSMPPALLSTFDAFNLGRFLP